jgi:DNA processing protein
VTYPPEHQKLAQQIAAEGLLVSEQPMGLTPQAGHFPRRNRLISGLAQAVVVVEAAARSGSLLTARMALDQGREVLAVPGHPFDVRAAGSNMLLHDGARLVRNADDILETLPLHAAPAPTARPAHGAPPPLRRRPQAHHTPRKTPHPLPKQHRPPLPGACAKPMRCTSKYCSASAPAPWPKIS